MEGYLTFEQRLVDRGILSPDEMERVVKLQQEQRAPFTRLVVELGFVSEDDLLPVLSEHFGIPVVSMKDYPVTPLPLDPVMDGVDFFKSSRMVPLKVDGRDLLVAMTDPTDFARLHALEVATHLKVRPVLAKEKDISARIEAVFGNGNSTESLGESGTRDIEGTDQEEVEHLRDMASEAPVIRLVNQLMSRALESRASDIHIEPFENQLKVRYRIDGILHEMDPPPRQLKAAIISRIKILAQLNIAERRLPQDGRIKVKIAGKDVDLRISTIPTLYGESVVIRLLERSQIFTSLDESLGFPPDIFQHFNEMIAKPHGMLLVTGPTGSGKSTTLYCALQKINDPAKKIITIEDPVEYQLNGVNQIHVKPQIGLTFANGLRSIVRQDPDVIMIGEIRDAETAGIAIQAALTGHLVFSTLHTNDAAGAVSRLLEMGVEDYLLASALLGVLAQRLVRKLCMDCRKQVPFESSRLEEFTGTSVWEPVGCDACSGTGYLGRMGIFELLPATPEICKLIVQRSDANKIRGLAMSQGMRLLREDGWQKVRDGVTTLAEVLRVTREES